MTDVIADDFEVELGIDQSLHASVSQRVGTRATNMNTRLAQVLCRLVGHGNRRHRSDRCHNPEE